MVRKYGKRSVRFWVALYLVAGMVLYITAYLLFAHGHGASTAGSGY